MILKQSIAYNRMFSMRTSASHYAALTGASPTVNISKNGGAFAAAAGSVSEVANGFYKIVLSTADTNTIGDLSYYIIAASGDPVYMVDQVRANVFADLTVDGSGNVSIASNIKKNQALSGFSFLMTNSTTHTPGTGLTVSAQRSLNGAGFAPCANSVSELSNGIYYINLAATDTNANTIMLRFTASGADDVNISIITQP